VAVENAWATFVCILALRSDPRGKLHQGAKHAAMDRLRASGQPRAAALVDGLADSGGILDEFAVNDAFLAAHLELARLSEFVHVPQRMAHSLRPIVERLRER